MDLHSGLPYWMVKNSLFDYFHPLESDYSTDVVIIGGGITGALVAHELCSNGIKCCLVDKRSIATGSSAASTALLQYEIDVPLCRMAEMIGMDKAVTAYHACLRSITDIEKVLSSTGVDADFERYPSLFYASNREGGELLLKEYQLRKDNDLPVEYLDTDDLFRVYGFMAPGALLNRASAQMDAYKAATGLLKHQMAENELHIFTHTEIVNCDDNEDGCVLTTDRGHRIECSYVIIAAGFEAGKFLPQQVMKLTSTYAFISHPVEERMLWPETCLIWETGEPYIYIRTDNKNRIIIGGEDDDFNDADRREALLREKVEILKHKFGNLFPEIPLKPEMSWCGTFSVTKDGLPFIGSWPGRERMIFNLGYGGNGITFSMIGAQIIRNTLLGISDSRQSVFSFERILK